MKLRISSIACVCLYAVLAYGQGNNTVPLGETVYFDCNTFDPTTGAASAADSTPTFNVYENATDTAIINGTNMTARTGHTGEYRGTFAASIGNGFEIGKWYTTKCYATVGGLSQFVDKMHFRVIAAETTAGTPKVDVAAIVADAITASSIATDAVTELQYGIKTWVKNTTISNYPFKLTKAGAAYTGGTSATIACVRSIDGGAFAACAAGTTAAIAEISIGWYKTNVAAADVNGDIVVFKFSVPTDAAVVPWEQPIAMGH